MHSYPRGSNCSLLVRVGWAVGGNGQSWREMKKSPVKVPRLNLLRGMYVSEFGTQLPAESFLQTNATCAGSRRKEGRHQ